MTNEAIIDATLFAKKDDVVIPDRYETLSRIAVASLETIVVPVEEMLSEIDKLYETMCSSRRGVFAILRGDSGAGKTTFLHTISLYRKKVSTVSVSGSVPVPDFLNNYKHAIGTEIQVIVL